MRITDLKVHLVPFPAQPPFRWRDGLPGSAPAGTGAYRRILTDAGIEGIAVTHRGALSR